MKNFRERMYLECQICKEKFGLYPGKFASVLEPWVWIGMHAHDKDVFESLHIHLVSDLAEEVEKPKAAL